MSTLFDENRFESEIDSKVKTIVKNEIPTTNYYSAKVIRKDSEGVWWVRLDGNDEETPVLVNKVDMSVGDMVTVMVRDHQTFVDGNLTSPPMSAANAQAYVNTVVARDIKAVTADIGFLKADVATIGYAQIEDADITNARIQNLVTQYTSLEGSFNVLEANALTANSAVITNLQSETAKIENLTAENLEAAVGYIEELESENITTGDIQAATGYIHDLEADNITTGDIQAATGYIHDLEADNITTGDIQAATGYIGVLQAGNVTASNIVSDHGTITNLDSNYAHITHIDANTAVIDNAKIGYADVTGLSANFAQITNGHINSALIDTAAIVDEQVFNVTGNKATIARIDASKINVANLRASNLIVDRINGQPVLGGYVTVNSEASGYSSMNPVTQGWYEFTAGGFVLSQDTVVDSSKVYYSTTTPVELYDQGYIDTLESQMNQRIDGAIEVYSGTDVPLTVSTSYPYSEWYDSTQSPVYDVRAEHVGNIYYVIDEGYYAVSTSISGYSSKNPAEEDWYELSNGVYSRTSDTEVANGKTYYEPNRANGYCYRFYYDNTSHEYAWVLIKDSDVTAALGRITDLETFESTTTTWIDETDRGIETIRQNHTELSGVVAVTVKATRQLWYTKSNTTPPTKPADDATTGVTNNSSTGNTSFNQWNLAVPVYNSSYPNYFYCWEYELSNGKFRYSAVVYDQATTEAEERARTGVANAATAQNTANANIKQSIQLWKTVTQATTTVSKPFSDNSSEGTGIPVTTTTTNANTWTVAVPTYNATYPKYYYCYQQQKGDGKWTCTAPIYDQATTEAMSKAQAALPASTYETFVQTTFKDVVDTVDEQSSTITQLAETTRYGGVNLLSTTPLKAVSADYDAYRLALSEPLESGATYTLQLWNVDVAHSAKTEAQLGVWVYYCGGNVCFGSWSGSASFTSGHADYLKMTFTPYTDKAAVTDSGTASNTMSHSSVAGADPKFLVLYNSVPSATGTRAMSVAKWKLERGSIATPYDYAPGDITTISNTVNSVKQTATSNSSSISSLTTTVANNKTEIENRASKIEQTLDGFSSTVSATIAESVSGTNVIPSTAVNPNGWTISAPSGANYTKTAYGSTGTTISFSTVGGYENLYSPAIPVIAGATYTLAVDYTVSKAYNIASGHSPYGLGVYAASAYPGNSYDEALASFLAKAVFFNVETRVVQTATCTFTATASYVTLMLNGGQIADSQTNLGFTIDNIRLVESVSSRVTQAETSISQTANAIGLTASGSATIANPNLSPFFEISKDDASYWLLSSQQTDEVLDGWMMFDMSTASSSDRAIQIRPKRTEWVKPGSVYTLLVEIADMAKTGNVYWMGVPNGSVEQIKTTDEIYKGNTVALPASNFYAEMTASTTAISSSSYTALVAVAIMVKANATFTGKVRISLYEGKYTGPWKPYAGSQLYASQAELSVQADRIGLMVQNQDGTGSLSLTSTALTAIADNIILSGTTQFVNGSTLGDYVGNAVDAVEVGGRNIAPIAKLWFASGRDVGTSYTVNGVTTTYLGDDLFRSAGTTTSVGDVWIFNSQVSSGGFNGNNAGAFSYSVTVEDGTFPSSGLVLQLADYNGTTWSRNIRGGAGETSVSFELAAGHHACTIGFYSTAANTAVDFTYRLKLEKGNKPTDWTLPIEERPKASLSPFFGFQPIDTNTGRGAQYWQSITNPSGFMTLEDGWVRYETRDNTSGSSILYDQHRPKTLASISPETVYTLMVEFKNVTKTGNVYLRCPDGGQSGAASGVVSVNGVPNTSIDLAVANGVYYKTFKTAASSNTNYSSYFGLCTRVDAGAKATFDMRLSIYDGVYYGPYQPYDGIKVVMEQQIYRRLTSNSTPATPTAWVTESSNTYSSWTTKVPPLASGTDSSASGYTKYPYLFVCTQRKQADGTVVCTAPKLDDSATVIDGGSIITNSITANQINTLAIDIGSFGGSIGGTNLLGRTDNPYSPTIAQSNAAMTFGSIGLYNSPAAEVSIENYDNSANALVVTSTVTGNRGVAWYTKPGEVVAGKDYTFSCRVKTSVAATVHVHTAWRNGSATAAYAGWTAGGNMTTTADTWVDYSYTFKPDASAQLTWEFLIGFCFSGATTGITMRVAHAKLEKGSVATDWQPSPDDLESFFDGYTILWNYESFSTANNGEGYICALNPKTGVRSDADGWTMWNGIKRTIPKGMVNPNAVHAYNRPTYVVCRLSSATATTGTNYIVSYNSGWKGGTINAGALSDWTWNNDTDIILGKYVEPSSEGAFVECEVYNPPWTSKQVTTSTTTSASAQSTANSANSKTDYYNRSCHVGNSSNTQTNLWRKFASYTCTAANYDPFIVFDVFPSGDMGDYNRAGRLEAHVRTAGTVGTVTASQCTLKWLWRGDGFALSDFVMVYKATSGTNVVIELWCRCPTSWIGYRFYQVFEGDRNGSPRTSALWTLYNSFTADGEASYSTDGYVKVESTDTSTAYITRTDNTGIEIHPATSLTDKLHIDANGTKIYKGGNLKANYADTISLYGGSSESGANPRTDISSSHLYMYDAGGVQRVSVNSGTGVILGHPSRGRAQLTDAGMTVYDNNNKIRTVINTSGMDVRDTDGTTSVASFGQTARIGRPSNARLMMNSNSIQAYDDSNNLYFEITGAGLGGQNLLRDTRMPIAFDVNAASSYMTHALYSTDGVNDNSGEDRSLAELGLVSGDKVTLSFDWSIEQNGSNAFTYGYFRIEMYGTKSDNTEGYIAAYYSTNAATFSASNLSGHYKKTVTLDANTVKTRRLVVRVDNSVLTLNISHMKLERGAMSSDWTEHPSDVTASIKTLVDTSNGLSSKVTKLENGLALSSTYFTQTDEGFVFNSEKIDEIDGNVEKISRYVRIEDDTLILGSKDPSISQPVAAQLSSTGLTFHEASGGTLGAPIASFEIVDGRGKLVVHNAVVLQDLEFGDWAWAKRPNGNLALRWTGA